MVLVSLPVVLALLFSLGLGLGLGSGLLALAAAVLVACCFSRWDGLAWRTTLAVILSPDLSHESRQAQDKRAETHAKSGKK